MVSRRGFLTSCLALGAAPAIVRAESLMKIWVPKQEIITFSAGGGDIPEYKYITIYDMSSGETLAAIDITESTPRTRNGELLIKFGDGGRFVLI